MSSQDCPIRVLSRLDFRYTHFTPTLRKRLHDFSLLLIGPPEIPDIGANANLQHRIVFDGSPPHGDWSFRDDTLYAFFEDNGREESAFWHTFTQTTTRDADNVRLLQWYFPKWDLEPIKGRHDCWLTCPSYAWFPKYHIHPPHLELPSLDTTSAYGHAEPLWEIIDEWPIPQWEIVD